MTIVLIVTLVTLPLQLAFFSASIARPERIILNSAASLIFLIDILLNLRTGFIGAESDQVVLDSQATAL